MSKLISTQSTQAADKEVDPTLEDTFAVQP